MNSKTYNVNVHDVYTPTQSLYTYLNAMSADYTSMRRRPSSSSGSESPPPKTHNDCKVKGCYNRRDLNVDPECRVLYRSQYCKDHACVYLHMRESCVDDDVGRECIHDAPRRVSYTNICKMCINEIRLRRRYDDHERSYYDKHGNEHILENYTTVFGEPPAPEPTCVVLGCTRKRMSNSLSYLTRYCVRHIKYDV